MSEETLQPQPEAVQPEQQPQPSGTQSTPAELALAESMMNPGQHASSEFRQQHAAELVKTPVDLDYTEPYRSFVGLTHGAISGTFEGQRVSVEKSAWDGEESMRYYGDIDGSAMTAEEAKAMWDKLSPQAELAHSQNKLEHEARAQVEKGARAESQRRVMAELQSGAEVENQAFDRFKKVLVQNFEKIDIEEDSPDLEFLEKSVPRIAMLAALEPGRGPYSFDLILKGPSRIGESRHDWSARDDYNRRVDLLFQLVGVNKEAGQLWVEGMAGDTNNHSRVFPTSLEGIALREVYEVTGYYLKLETPAASNQDTEQAA